MQDKRLRNAMLILVPVCLSLTVALTPLLASAGLSQSTRITDPKEHACAEGGGRYPYRQKADYVLAELDLRPGDVVVDIGAGDGWWAEQMAATVGPTGTIHAAEVEQNKVHQMAERYADTPQTKPYVCPYDGTALPDNVFAAAGR